MSTATKTAIATITPVAHRLLDALAPYCERIELAGTQPALVTVAQPVTDYQE